MKIDFVPHMTSIDKKDFEALQHVNRMLDSLLATLNKHDCKSISISGYTFTVEEIIQANDFIEYIWTEIDTVREEEEEEE